MADSDGTDPNTTPPVVIRHAHAVQVPYFEDEDPSNPGTPIAKAYKVASGTVPVAAAAAVAAAPPVPRPTTL